MLGVSETELIKPAGAKKRKSVHFKPDDEIINPEDVDPSVGRFRNLVQTSLIPNNDRNKAKRFKNDQSSNSSAFSILFKNSFGSSISSGNRSSDKNPLARNILAMNLPNSAPDLEEFSNPTKKNIEKIEEDDNKINRIANEDDEDGETMNVCDDDHNRSLSTESRKKKYAKEAWPGHEKTTSLTNF